MVDCLNAVGCTHVCFGNHECDVPHGALLERIAQFEGVWLNSNMPGITEGSGLGRLPEYDVVEAESEETAREKDDFDDADKTPLSNSLIIAFGSRLCDYY